MKAHTVYSYKFSELPLDVQESALDKWREHNLDYEWWDSVYYDAGVIAKILGIELDNIYFSGFWCQGDGACFDGSYSYAKGCAKNIRAYAGNDTRLHDIADRLVSIQKANNYQLAASVKHSGNYSHEYCTDIDVYRDDSFVTDETVEEIIVILRDFMRWIYSQLQADYEYLQSDEAIKEVIEANDYDFDALGSLA